MVDAGHTRKARSAWFRLHPTGLSGPGITADHVVIHPVDIGNGGAAVIPGPGTTAATQHPACGVVLVSTYYRATRKTWVTFLLVLISLCGTSIS